MPAPNHVTPASAPLKAPALLQGLLPFDRSQLWRDLLAGLTLAALGIPEVMGYTQIIGTPVIKEKKAKAETPTAEIGGVS